MTTNDRVRQEEGRGTPADDHRKLIDRIDRTIDALMSERTRLGEALARLDVPADSTAGRGAGDRER